MADSPALPTTCVVCGQEKEIKHSLRLTRDKKGTWISNPVCQDCRGALIREAKQARKFIPFFGIDASIKEAAKRNEQSLVHRPFLEKFAVPEREKPERSNPAKVTPIRKSAS